MNAVFLDWGSIDNHDLDRQCLQELPVHWQFYDATAIEQLTARLTGQDIVVSNKVPLSDGDLSNGLKLICVAATGFNNVDIRAAALRDIPVCNVRGYATTSVVQHVFMLILNLFRHLPDYQLAVRAGHWQDSEHFCLLDYPIEELAGKKIGIVGYGTLGRAVADMAEQFGMQVLLAQRLDAEPQPDREELPELLAQVDVLSLHCPLSDKTRGLIGERELAWMKPSAILINTARGGIVDEVALLDALSGGRLGGAGIDVLTVEPPIAGNVLLQTRLPNLIVTPHIAWASRQARQRLIEGVAQNVRDFMAGHTRNRVN